MPSKKTNRSETRLAGTPSTNEPVANENETAGPGDVDFFAQLQAFTADDWQSGLKTYVYRNWPVIDRRDENHFLAKISEPFDEDYLLRHFGSGKYYLRLNNRRGETINSKTVSVHDPDYPPKVSPDEVVQTDPRNERYFKVWPTSERPTKAPTETAAIHELSKLAFKALDQRESPGPADGQQPGLTNTLVNWALSQTSKDRDAAAPTQIAALLKEMKSLFPQQQPQDSLQMIDRVMSIVEKLNPVRPAVEPQDPLEYVERALALTDRLRPQAPPVVPATDGGTLASVASIVHEAVDLLRNPLTIAAQVWAATKAKSAGPNEPHPYPPSPQPQRPRAEAGTPPQTQQAQPSPEMIALVNAVTPVMLKWLQADAPGQELGSDFAEWVLDGWGSEGLNSLQEVGTDAIIELYKHSPAWLVIAPMQQKFSQFVEAFVRWMPPADDSETDSEADNDAERF